MKFNASSHRDTPVPDPPPNRRKSDGAAWFLAGLLLAISACSADTIFSRSSASTETATDAVIVPHPSWPTGMPDGIPAPENGSLVFQAEIALENDIDVGLTQYGRRRVRVGGEGTVSGPRMTGTVMPGALDFDLTLSNGVVEREQILVLRTGDNHYVFARGAGAGPDQSDVRTVLEFEAPSDSPWAWLHDGQFVARRVDDPDGDTIAIAVYDVTDVAPWNAEERVVRIEKPDDMPPQPWDYRVADQSEARGQELIVETVTLSPGQSVGLTRDGIRRNIIPITGGTLDGRIAGTILFGGADYQNLSAPATIDARYLWQTDDGEIIIVRNGGPFGGLVPTFETRADGRYAWLNTGLYLSANPAGAPGGVAITMYESTR